MPPAAIRCDDADVDSAGSSPFNQPIASALTAWTLAQAIKVGRGLWRQGRMDFRLLFSTGGMPSAHTAMVAALATSIGLVEGFGSSLFALAAVFAAVVMFDAQSVRHAAGQQARLLNQIVEELFKNHRLSEHKLAELLGHTRLEVLAGLMMGALVAFAVRAAVRAWT